MSTAVAANDTDDWIISVDDHIIEPPDLWTSRIPAKYQGSCPQVREDEQGEAWFYEGRRISVSGVVVQAGAGAEGYDPAPIRYADIRPSCYDAKARLHAMDEDGVLASMAFPNMPRFCGQEFYEARDKELGLLCVQAYNDFVTEEWADPDPARMIPAIIIPHWDPSAAGKEVERCAAKGAKGICFSEHPPSLGLPSIHDPGRYWDPLFAAASDTGLPLSIHIGSSSKIPNTGPDAPLIISAVLIRWVSATTCVDWLFCDALRRHPNLRVSLSEGGISWFPAMIEATTYAVEHYEYLNRFQVDGGLQASIRDVPAVGWPHGDARPIDVMRDHVRGCYVAGLGASDTSTRFAIEGFGSDLFLAEADFPHHDSSYPDTRARISGLLEPFGAEDKRKLRQDNAIEWYSLDRNALGLPA